MKKWIWINFLLVIGLLWPGLAVQGQQASGPVYIVQPGDTLGEIARRFGVPLQDLLDANAISNPNILAEGAELVIPGLEGIEGTLTTVTVAFGEDLRSLSRGYGVSISDLARLNHLTSPLELYTGSDLVLPQGEGDLPKTGRALLAPGQTLLELAALEGENPWALAGMNGYTSLWRSLPGETLLTGKGEGAGPGALPGEIHAAALEPQTFSQGRTNVVRISGSDGLDLSGTFLGKPLHFFYDGNGSYIALQGVHALMDPGLYPISLEGRLADGTPFAFAQLVIVRPVDYPFDMPLNVDPATIDPTVTQPEDAQWTALALPATPERLWDGLFRIPSPLEQEYCVESGECWTSRFGNRRSYNGSPYQYFHTGLDVAGGTGTEIYAPADGVVVFAGPMTVRGNATMIDHGWGVYTGYMHQSELRVEVGDRVKAGQLIGLVGGTGRAQGPHLHWEVWAGGVQVDPLEWLERVFP